MNVKPKDFAHKIGKVPLCNGRRDRAPIIHGWCFLLCWRCTAIIISVIICCFTSYVLYDKTHISVYTSELLCIAVLMIIPMLIDGIRQYCYYKESNNIRRIITGFLAGIGFWIISGYIAKCINYFTR